MPRKRSTSKQTVNKNRKRPNAPQITRTEQITVGRNARLYLAEIKKGRQKKFVAVLDIQSKNRHIQEQWYVDPNKDKKIKSFEKFKEISVDIAKKLKKLATKK